jgi:hypothetical protein
VSEKDAAEHISRVDFENKEGERRLNKHEITFVGSAVY